LRAIPFLFSSSIFYSCFCFVAEHSRFASNRNRNRGKTKALSAYCFAGKQLKMANGSAGRSRNPIGGGHPDGRIEGTMAQRRKHNPNCWHRTTAGKWLTLVWQWRLTIRMTAHRVAGKWYGACRQRMPKLSQLCSTFTRYPAKRIWGYRITTNGDDQQTRIVLNGMGMWNVIMIQVHIKFASLNPWVTLLLPALFYCHLLRFSSFLACI